MSEYKIVKCQNYGPTANVRASWFEVHKLGRFPWFRKWKPIKGPPASSLYSYMVPVRFTSKEEAEDCIDRLKDHKPNTTVREDVPLD